jgi:hypothetical protein
MANSFWNNYISCKKIHMTKTIQYCIRRCNVNASLHGSAGITSADCCICESNGEFAWHKQAGDLRGCQQLSVVSEATALLEAIQLLSYMRDF